MPLQPGTTLGPYTVTAQIGAGGMGQVYRARVTKLDRAQGATGGVHVGSRSIDRTHQQRRKATYDASTP